MKVRDSGMPDEATWEGFFDPPAILDRLGLEGGCGDVVEFGCGYGTFTVPAARVVGEAGTVHAIDLEADMLRRTRRRAEDAGVGNVRLIRRDFMTAGSGLADGSAGYAMLFNILHPEDPAALLAEAQRILRPGGLLGVIHWNHDPATPRGPDMSFRPRPAECLEWARCAGFEAACPGPLDLPPYHWGLLLRSPSS